MKSNSENLGLFPEKYRILSGSALKMLAVITMLIDHIAASLLINCPSATEEWFEIGEYIFSVYYIMRYIGRLAFPIYAFLLTEGYIHTRNHRKYGTNLLLFALISEIPWNLEHSGSLFFPNQNVFFTLFFGYLGICALEYYSKEAGKCLLCLVTLLFITVIFKADYGASGYGFILLVYVLRNNRIVQAVIGSCILSYQWIPGLAFIPINMYNGKRGFITGKTAKYAFYAFYPLHLLALFFVKQMIFS